MQSRKVYQILQQLPPELFPKLRRFLNSPYFDHSKSLKLLAERLLLAIEQGEALSPETAFASIYPEKAFIETSFAKLCNALLKAVHRFLVVEELAELPSQQEALLFRAYSRKGLGKWVPKQYQKSSKKLVEEALFHPTALEALLNIKWEHAAFLFRQPRRPRGEALLSIDQSLDHYYWMRKYELGTAIFNYNQVFNADLPTPELPKLSPENLHIGETPQLVWLNYHAYHLLSSGDEKHFEWIWQSLKSSEGKVNPVELRPFYLLALNHCIYQYYDGREDYLEKVDEIYLELIDKGFLLFRDQLAAEHFKNIITVRLDLGQLDWVEAFFESFKDRLSNDLDGAVQAYILALIHFEKGVYDSCMRILEGVLQDGKQDVFLTPDARRLQLKACYLRQNPGDDVLCEHLHNAFRVFLIRDKKIGTKERSRMQGFVKYVGKLLRLRGQLPEEREAEALLLLQELSEDSSSKSRSWIFQQVKQLLPPNPK